MEIPKEPLHFGVASVIMVLRMDRKCGKHMKNIILVGMPGSGKSTLGVLLAKRLGYGYIDSDSVLVAQTGKRLPALIETLGNDGFLEKEAQVNASLVVESCVIATGGSAIYRRDAIDKMRQNGIVVYLQLSCEALAKRLGNWEQRGVVCHSGCTLEELYAERSPLYEAAADCIVSLDDTTIEAAAERVYKAVQDCR